MSKRVGVS